MVGRLEEMDPDDRLAAVTEKQRGGCLLGYNQNGGQVIYLRLRQNERGQHSIAFRPYTELIDTLLHELCHNLSGPHNLVFWRLFGLLKGYALCLCLCLSLLLPGHLITARFTPLAYHLFFTCYLLKLSI